MELRKPFPRHLSMNLNIEGNPGAGNRFEHTHIQHVDCYSPNAQQVKNNHTTIFHVSLLSIHINGTSVVSLFKVLKRWLNARCREKPA